MKHLTASLLLTGLTAAFTSCGSKGKDERAPEPVKPPAIRRLPSPSTIPSNPTDAFRTPADDTNLPTAAQLADGEAPQPATNPGISPPPPAATPKDIPAPSDKPTAPENPAEDRLDAH